MVGRAMILIAHVVHCDKGGVVPVGAAALHPSNDVRTPHFAFLSLPVCLRMRIPLVRRYWRVCVLPTNFPSVRGTRNSPPAVRVSIPLT